MHEFQVRLGSQGSKIVGVASSVSADGRLRLLELGATSASVGAGELLAHFGNGAERPPAELSPPVGCILEDTVTGRIRVFAAPVAQRCIYWATQAGVLSLGSSPAAAGAALGTSATLEPSAVYHYLYFHFLPTPLSAFAGLERLCPGHVLDFHSGNASIARWWRPSFSERTSLSLDDASRELRRLLEAAVARSAKGTERFGAFLSGGLDSSTVAGFAAKLSPGVATVSMGFDAEGYDEIDYARIAARRFGTRAMEYYVTPEDVLRTLPDIAGAFPEPFGNSSAAAVFQCARIAREQGLELLLAGDGGDELFGGNDRYAHQLKFERYLALPSPLRKLVGGLVGGAAAFTDRFPVGKARSFLRQAAIPLPDRLQQYNFLEQLSPDEIFDADLLRHVDRTEPLARLRAEYGVPENAEATDRMLFLDWKFTLHDNDLVKVNTMCNLGGVRVAYPMLDAELLQFSMRVPSDWKVHRGTLRWFYKKALEEFLPAEIINKTKHGFGLPFGRWTRTHGGLQAMAADALASLANRRFFRRDFISTAQRLHMDGHAAYYGELVWILMAFELWLQRHLPRAGL